MGRNPASRKLAIRWRLAAPLVVAYLLASAAAAGGLVALRSNVLAQESSPEAIQSWQHWKAETQQMNRGAPVARRPVTSNEPPALILLRDYFANVLVAVEIIIFGVFAFLVIVLWSRLRDADSARQRSP